MTNDQSGRQPGFSNHKSYIINHKSNQGVAIIIVLAFIVLVTGLIVAFFSRSLLDRQVSNSSASQTKVELFAQGAIDTTIGDLKQEIIALSTGTTVTTGTVTSTIYFPTSNTYMMPMLAGSTGTNGLENLLKVSGTAVPYTGGTSRASGDAGAVTTVQSLNGRFLTAARWNKALLMPVTGSNNYAPPASASFTPPNWILVARDGSNPRTWSNNLVTSSSNSTTVVGRYAYTIYHEGGLLDANVAGYPSTTGTNQSAYKPALAYADLQQIGLTSTQIDQLVGWRNYVSAQATGSLPGYTFSSGSAYNQFVLSNTTGFISVSGSLNNGQTDRMFVSRQELLNFLQSGLGLSATSLTYRCLSTFSREINQTSYISPVQTNPAAPVVLAVALGGNNAVGVDKRINPSFPTVRVQASFTRNDGSTANVGEPLVKKRFALQRLSWVTYKGPSFDLYSSNPSDPVILALIANGIPASYLQQGTAANIQKYFGLTWDATNTRWKYDLHRGSILTTRFIRYVGRPTGTAANPNVFVQDSNREPDFFELLKAGICVGSLGKAATSSATAVGGAAVPSGYVAAQVPINMRYNFDSAVDYHIIQIGANILSEVNPASYPIRIAFDDGTARGLWEFQGVTDLPYLSYVFNGVLRTQAPQPGPPSSWADWSPFQYPNPVTTGSLTTSGSAYMIQVPAVWNPYDPNGTPGVLRPSQFRVVVDSNDPLVTSGSSNDLPIFHGAEATPRTTSNAYGGDNSGMGLSDGVFSWNATGVGRTTEIPGTNGTPVYDAVTFNDGNGALYREPTLIFSTTVGGATRTAGNITGIDANPLPGESDGSMGPWAPLVLGQFPLAFSSGTTTYYAGVGVIGNAAGNGDNRVYFTYRLQYQDTNGTWVTYDTKYGRTTHGLFSFQIRNSCSTSVIIGPNPFNPYSWAAAMDPRTARFGLIMETMNQQRSRSSAVAPPADGWIFDSSGATTTGITAPIRKDNSHGYYFVSLDGNNVPSNTQNADRNFGMLTANINNLDIPYPSFAAGWASPIATINEGHGPSDVWMCAPGLYAQNNPSVPFYDGSTSTIEPSYYADSDGVVRRASGAYVPFGNTVSASTPVGLAPASIQGFTSATSSLMYPVSKTPFTQSQSRPLLLHRPFRSVAELGYVFRDLPWKNLDFFTPESGDAALLDLFCINETGDSNSLVAGKVNLNTRQAPVLAAIVGGAYVDDPKISDTTVGSLSTTLANAIGTALTARTADTTNYGPLQNPSELVGKWQSAAAITSGTAYSPVLASVNCGTDLALPNYKDGRLSFTGFSGNTVTTSGKDLSAVFTPATAGTIMESLANVQRFHEAPIRALANVGQTRVWNLLIDVVAQTGRYPQSATALDKFMVEGEQRYWVHIAIDRYTGQILDKQIEVVKE